MKYCLSFFLLIVISGCYGNELQDNVDRDLESKKLDDKFVIFDATAYKNKPDLEEYGIRPLQTVSRFWNKGEDKEMLPDEYQAKNYSRKMLNNKDIAFVNVEHWPLKGLPDKVYTNKNKYKTIIEWVKEAAPNVDIGLYSMVPHRDYWRAIKGSDSNQYKEWQRENDQLTDLVNSSSLDIIYPSLYTFYRNREGWVKYAIANIKEARRYNTKKPVYIFLWPQYHNSNKLLGLDYIPADYWMLELETVFQYADGVVIWGGWDFEKPGKAEWDENAPWWKATKEFMRKIHHEK